MSNFGGRRPNVSQYLANLNVIPSEHEQQQEDGLDFTNDLALFTNTDDFIDFDGPGNMSGTNTGAVGENGGSSVRREGLDFLNGDYPFDPSTFDQNAPPPGLPTCAPHNAFSHDLSSPAYSTTMPSAVTYASPQSHPSPTFSPNQAPGSAADSTEEAARLAAEEDKRRRNTAASARFRVKKKQREQALEKSTKELTDKVTALQKALDQSQQENKFLRSLVIEKKGDEGLKEQFQKFRKESEECDERSTGGEKKGVGTKTGK